MAVIETALEMCVRHVVEQEDRIIRQEALIERLRKARLPLDAALQMLREMRVLLEEMRSHVTRLSN